MYIWLQPTHLGLISIATHWWHPGVRYSRMSPHSPQVNLVTVPIVNPVPPTWRLLQMGQSHEPFEMVIVGVAAFAAGSAAAAVPSRTSV